MESWANGRADGGPSPFRGDGCMYMSEPLFLSTITLGLIIYSVKGLTLKISILTLLITS